MTHGLGGVSALLLAALTTGGCTTLQDVSAGFVGCKPDDIEIEETSSGWNSKNWIAVCNGRRYSCSHFQTGGGPGGTASQVQCSPIGAAQGGSYGGERPPIDEGMDSIVGVRSQSAVAPARPSPRARYRASKSSNRAERIYNEERSMHVVRASFDVGKGLKLNVVGIPKLVPGKLALTVAGPTAHAELLACESIEALVNAEPFASAENARASTDQAVALEGRFEAALFAPIAQQYSTFGIRACGAAWQLDESQMEEMKKLLVMFEQLDQQLNGSGGQTTPETEPQATAAP